MTQAEMTNQEQSLRVDMAAGFRWLQRWEMHDLAAGSLVARLPGQTEWMFTHTQGVYFNEIRASDLFKVSFDDEALDGSNQRSNYAAVNPAAKIFNARPDVNAIVHVHPHAVVAVSALECGILPITPLAFMFQQGEVAWIETDFNFPDDYCEQMAETLGDGKILMIRNHAFTAVGKTVAEAMYLAYAFTETCKLQMQILSTNQKLHIPTDEEIEYHALGFTGENCRKMEDGTIGLEYDGSMEWAGLLRVLDREEPDYRN
jgi:ribulose-5-phosphate 4-epimerase/fuculose-1-phosphate aldolase